MLTLVGGSLGFMLASMMIIPLQGDSIIGPWAIMALGFILGGALGYVVGPMASGLFEADSPLRNEPRTLSRHDPASGRTLKPADTAGRRVV